MPKKQRLVKMFETPKFFNFHQSFVTAQHHGEGLGIVMEMSRELTIFDGVFDLTKC